MNTRSNEQVLLFAASARTRHDAGKCVKTILSRSCLACSYIKLALLAVANELLRNVPLLNALGETYLCFHGAGRTTSG